LSFRTLPGCDGKKRVFFHPLPPTLDFFTLKYILPSLIPVFCLSTFSPQVVPGSPFLGSIPSPLLTRFLPPEDFILEPRQAFVLSSDLLENNPDKFPVPPSLPPPSSPLPQSVPSSPKYKVFGWVLARPYWSKLFNFLFLCCSFFPPPYHFSMVTNPGDQSQTGTGPPPPTPPANNPVTANHQLTQDLVPPSIHFFLPLTLPFPSSFPSFFLIEILFSSLLPRKKLLYFFS